MQGSSVQQRPATLRLIILYKLARALISAALGGVLAYLALTGVVNRAESFATQYHHEATSALALQISAFAVTLLHGSHVWIMTGALLLDAAVLLLEAWALHTGKDWGAWLVVAASSGLLPFEVAALVDHTAGERIAVLLINLAIVGYLLGRIRRHR